MTKVDAQITPKTVLTNYVDDRYQVSGNGSGIDNWDRVGQFHDWRIEYDSNQSSGGGSVSREAETFMIGTEYGSGKTYFLETKNYLYSSNDRRGRFELQQSINGQWIPIASSFAHHDSGATRSVLNLSARITITDGASRIFRVQLMYLNGGAFYSMGNGINIS